MRKLEGKVALITGSGRGIGQALALKLAHDGARLVINDLDPQPVEETLELLRAEGAQAVALKASVTATDFGDRFVKLALDAFGGIDIIVNNAGYTWDAVIQKMGDEQFQAMLDVHVTAPFRILRAAAEPIKMLARREMEQGREVFRKVVNVSSIAGIRGNAGQVNYAAAKAALIGMTHTLCKEWGRYKVNVNCVAFGLINTRLTQALDSGEARIEVEGRQINVGIQPSMLKAFEQQLVPLGRAGTVQEAADGAYLFCIPESNYISGQVVIVGGGVIF